jgi:Tol biopolymer transport system component
MNSRKTLTIIMAISMILGSYQSVAQTAGELFSKAIQLEEVKGELEKAIEVYQTIITQFSADRQIASKAQLHIGLCYEKLGNTEARKAYELVLSDYADQAEPTKMARERLKALIGGSGGTAARSTEVSMRQIWVAGKDMPICISPDGRYVVFGVYDSGNLWLRDLQSGEQRQITRDGSRAEGMIASTYAAISQDGNWIAYNWWNKGYQELRLSKLDGSSMRILHNGQDGRTLYVTPTAWMPDGLKILAISFKNLVYSPHIISLSDGSVRDIGQPEPGSVIWGYPSPDGRHIAYSLNEDIFVYNTATEQDSVIIKTPSADGMVGWTPDGSGIMFVSNRSGSRDLYLLGIQNGHPHGEPQLLRRDLGDPLYLYVTRDGRLFQTENKGTWDSYTVPVDKQTGKLTSTPSLVAPGYSRTNFPAWSPDGKMLYYSRYKLTEGNRPLVLVIRSEETGLTREIIPNPELPFWHTPILSPDGSQFLVTGADQKGNSGVFTIDSESGAVSQLLGISSANDAVDPNPNWSPDGKVIFYMIRSSEKREELIIRRKDITTGEEKEVHRGIFYNQIKISPDGTRFVYFMNDKPAKSFVLGILDIQSGKELELWRVPGTEYPGGIDGNTWAPDGKNVLVSLNQKMGNELWRVPATGGPAEKLYFFPESTWGIVMHPSGKRLAFAQSRINFELWVMENFLPK